MSRAEHIVHPIPPLYNASSRVLILGSFPSVKSREAAFFYGHPQNRFWRLLARLFDEEPPVTTEQKRLLALRHHIALWDVIHSCTIIGSSDSSVRDVVPNDLSVIFENSAVERVFCNGALSHRLYRQYIYPETRIDAVRLPSTSPANAAFSIERLEQSWRAVAEAAEEWT